MLRYIRFLFVATLLCAFVYPARVAVAEQVVYVSTEDDLYQLELRPNGTFVLTEDIIFGSGKDVMFADKDNPFCGILDGGGHTLSYLNLRGDGEVIAFIGYLGKSGVVKNLNITNAEVISTNKNAYVGGIVAHNSGKIIDCSFSGYVRRDGKTLGEECFIAGFGTGTVEFSSNSPADNCCDICSFECDGKCGDLAKCKCFASTENTSSKVVYSETPDADASSDETTASDSNLTSSKKQQSYVLGGNKYSATDSEKTSSKTSSRKATSSVASISASEIAFSSENETTVTDISEETSESDGKDSLGSILIYSCSAVLVISCVVAVVKEVKCGKKSREDTEK